jgi:hypothetical protein
LVYPFQLTATYSGSPFSSAYIVDPLRESEPAEQRNPTFDLANVPVFADQQDEWNAAVQAAYMKGVSRVMDLHFERSRQAMMMRSLKEVIQEHGGDEFTEANIKRLRRTRH